MTNAQFGVVLKIIGLGVAFYGAWMMIDVVSAYMSFTSDERSLRLAYGLAQIGGGNLFVQLIKSSALYLALIAGGIYCVQKGNAMSAKEVKKEQASAS